MNQEPKILYVIGSAETEALGETLQRFGAVKQVGSMAEMNQALAAEMYDIVFCDASFADGTWHQALSVIQKKNWDVPVVVVKGKTSIEESTRLLGEVIAAGAFELLMLPTREMTALYILEHALMSREAEAMREVA
ncbi:MAG: hypothetical protein A3F68_11835 [Acidobacteria bacterium RIFCSPLOWO2_12_FULL_54_10]|nr:MAG: hypothetical protein A3F68_11835 [Acidobacteria bacterium RIFCSPLOWO2_12_FULL_54_10]